MKNVLIVIIVLVLLPITGLAQNGDDREAVKKAALDYIEGWYSGNPERMERAVYKDLVKRGIFNNPETGKSLVRPVTAEKMVEYTKKAVGKKPKDQWGIELTVQDVYKNTASVKIVSVDFIDYAQIGKIDGEWKIVNVLWEPIQKDKK